MQIIITTIITNIFRTNNGVKPNRSRISTKNMYESQLTKNNDI